MPWRGIGERSMPQFDDADYMCATDVPVAPSCDHVFCSAERPRPVVASPTPRSLEREETEVEVAGPNMLTGNYHISPRQRSREHLRPADIGAKSSAVSSTTATNVKGRVEVAEPTPDTGGSSSRSGGSGDLQLVRALGEVILRGHEAQVERLFEQGRRLEETLHKQQCTLAKLETQIGVHPRKPPIQTAASPHEVIPRPVVDTELEWLGSCEEDDAGKTEPLSQDVANVQQRSAQPQYSLASIDTSIADTLKEQNIWNRFAESWTPAAQPHEPAHPRAMISKMMKWPQHKSQLPPVGHVPNRCGASLVMSPAFSLLVGAMILINAVFMLAQTDNAARNPNDETPTLYIVVETIFFFLFAGELALRIWVFRCEFFTGDEWRWNCFDMFIVAAAACEQVVKFIEQGSNVAKKATMLRTTRVLKFGRITRMFRVVKFFRDLRIMMASIVATMMTLFWSVVCVLMIMLSFSTYFLTVVSDHQAMEGPDPKLDPFFGSVTAMVLSLFQATTGGFDWRELSDLLMTFSPQSVGVLCVYISMMHYAILNILTGICVHTAQMNADADFDIAIFEEHARQESVTAKLAKYFHSHNVSGEGEITWHELQHHLDTPMVQNGFKRLDLERWHLQSFFELLVADGKDEPSINIDSFLRGCKRFRCNVKNIDLITTTAEQDHFNMKQFSELRGKIDAVQSLMKASASAPKQGT